MPENGANAVISIWDESGSGFEFRDFYEIRNSLGVKYMAQSMTFVQSQAVVARVVAGETLIVPVRAKVGDLSSIYKFNGTGTLIWKLLQEPRTVTEIAAAVAEQYDVELSQAEIDVTGFINEMQSVGLVEAPVALPMAGD